MPPESLFSQDIDTTSGCCPVGTSAYCIDKINAPDAKTCEDNQIQKNL